MIALRPIFWLISARIVLAICVLLALWGAFAPQHGPQLQLFPWDKADHFSAFFALTASAILAFPRARLVWIGLILSFAGALIELIQGIPVVGGDMDFFDWVADTVAVGAVMGVIVAARFRRAVLATERPLRVAAMAPWRHSTPSAASDLPAVSQPRKSTVR